MTNSGFITNWFKPLRGAQQGCPFLPYLFIPSAELLSNKIRQDPNLKGLNEEIDLKGARSRFAHLEKFGLNFPRSSFEICVNLLHSELPLAKEHFIIGQLPSGTHWTLI